MNRTIFAAFSALVCSSAMAQGYLVVIDSFLDRALRLDAFDGHVVSNNWIGVRPGGGSSGNNTPINAIDSTVGTLLVSDQVADSVFEFNYDGSFVRTLVGPAQGLDNIRGIAVHGGRLYVAVGGGLLAQTVQSFNLTGGDQQTWVTLPATASVWDVTFRTDDALISDAGEHNIYRVRLSDKQVSVWHDSDTTTSYRFPSQIHIDWTEPDTVLVGGFSLPNTGVHQLQGTTFGFPTNFWGLPLNIGARGAYRLGNGKILWSSGTEVQVLDPANGGSTKVADLGGDPTSNSFRWIERVPGQTIAGKVILDGYVGNVSAFDFTFELRKTDGTVVETWTQKLAGDGSFSRFLLGRAFGSHNVHVIGGHWLGLSTSVSVGPYGTTDLGLSLTNGDIDRDNSVTVFDYGVLSDYFDKSSSDADWGTVGSNGFAPKDADLDGDDAVTVFDYGILSDNFDLSGD